MKLRSSIIRFLLLVTPGLLPSLCFAVSSDSCGNTRQMASQDEKINSQLPNLNMRRQATTDSMTGKVSFKIYYGRPYEYSPDYHPYEMPYHCCHHYKEPASGL